jgi:hypothetical protein
VPGSDLDLLVAVDVAGPAIAHACDGATVAAWFAGRVDGATLALHTSTHHLAATVRPDRIDGTLTLGDVALPFRLRPTSGGGGLFAARTEVDGVPHAASWVRLDGGRERGVLTVAGVAGPAPSLRPSGVVTPDGVRLEPVRLDRLSPKWGRLARAGD